MSELIQTYRPRQFTIVSLEGKKIDITNSILSIDYFEDLLSPAIHMSVYCANKYSIVSGLPIRGGEKVEVSIETGSGDFEFLGSNLLFNIIIINRYLIIVNIIQVCLIHKHTKS